MLRYRARMGRELCVTYNKIEKIIGILTEVIDFCIFHLYLTS